MKKLKYYNYIDQQSRKHEICLKLWGIRSRFNTLAEAETFQADIVQSLAALKRLFKGEEMEAARVTDLPYGEADIALIRNRIEAGALELHPLIAEHALRIPKGTIGQHEGRRQYVDPTIRQMVLQYALARRDGNMRAKRGYMKPLKLSKSGELPAVYRLWETAVINDTGLKLWNVKLSDVKQWQIETILDQLAAENQKMSINRHVKYIHALSGVWTLAMSRGECLHSLHIPRKLNSKGEEAANTPSYSEARIRNMIPKMYAEDEKNRALNAAPKRNAKMRMIHYGPLVVTAIYTGIRREFISSLHMDDIIYEEGQMFIKKRMKGDKMVKVFVPAPAVIVIEKQLDLDEVQAKKWIFPYEGYHMQGWYNRFKEILKENGWYDSPKPFHSFRSFAATQIYKMSKEVSGQDASLIVAQQLGVSYKVAQGYVDRAFITDETAKVLSGWEDYAPKITNPPASRRHLAVVPS